VAGALAGVALLPSSGAAQQFDHPRAEGRGSWHHRTHSRPFARSQWQERRGWRMEHRGWRMEHRGWRMERRGFRMEHRGGRMEHRGGYMEHRHWMAQRRWQAAQRARPLRHRSNGLI
jgi:hypothetical protein